LYRMFLSSHCLMIWRVNEFHLNENPLMKSLVIRSLIAYDYFVQEISLVNSPLFQPRLLWSCSTKRLSTWLGITDIPIKLLVSWMTEFWQGYVCGFTDGWMKLLSKYMCQSVIVECERSFRTFICFWTNHRLFFDLVYE
jgi:hypothetical protein